MTQTAKASQVGIGKYHIELPCGDVIESSFDIVPTVCPKCKSTFVGVTVQRTLPASTHKHITV